MKTDDLTAPQKTVLRRLSEGWDLQWNRDGESTYTSNCALWRGGSFYRVSPATLKALVARDLVRLIDVAVYTLRAELTPEGGDLVHRLRLEESGARR